jgi:hypothetical protein
MTSQARPAVYISFDLEHDEAACLRFAEELTLCPVPFSIEGSTPGEQPTNGRASIVQERIGRSAMTIFLIGKQTHTSTQVREELLLTRAANVPFFGVYIATGKPGQLPDGLPANRTIPWDWERIGSAISQLMNEGKHHVFK